MTAKSFGRNLLAATLIAWASPSWAQSGAVPGQEAADHAQQQQQAQSSPEPEAQQPVQPTPEQKSEEPPKSAWPFQEGHSPSYSAPAKYETVVRCGLLKDNDLIGEYDQPRWTGARLFPTTRVYVLPASTVQMEYWLDTKMAFEDANNVRFRNLYELEIGLGYRIQLDLYLRTEQQGYQGKMEVESEKIELRYAFADWGKIPGNPTIYLELSRFTEGPMTLEAKLLLGGNLAARAHWGVNLVFERDLGGSMLYNQYGVTGGLSFTIVDRKFSLGVELQFESTDGGRNGRGNLSEANILAGPTIQWRPVTPLHIDLVALFGALGEGDGAGAFDFKAGMRPLLVIGWEL